MPRKRQVKQSRQPVGEERPRQAVTPSSSGERLAWAFRHAARDDGHWPFSRLLADADKREAVLQRLVALETMTWHELSGKHHHAIPVADLCKNARDELAERGLDDFETVFSITITGRERLIGLRDGRAFALLWWDPEHQVCPSEKKHT